MDDIANLFARCGQKYKDYLHFTEYKLKWRECKPKRFSWDAYNCLESEVEKRVWYQDPWMSP
jgi:hypothetical protein